MQSDKGLKRSMPCSDLISMALASCKENTFRPFEACGEKRASSSAKRQRLTSSFIDMDSSSPATAALERALALDDDIHLELDVTLTSQAFRRVGYSNERSLVCRSSYKQKHILPTVNEVNEIAHGFAFMTTSA